MERLEELLDDIARLLAVQVRSIFESQSEAIVEMHRAGLAPSRIAELLGTSRGTVNVSVSRAKKRGAVTDER